MAYLVVIGGFVVLISAMAAVSDIVKARIRARTAEVEGAGGASRELAEQVEELRRQVAELAERQDFAERLLAKVRERGLPPGPPAP